MDYEKEDPGFLESLPNRDKLIYYLASKPLQIKGLADLTKQQKSTISQCIKRKTSKGETGLLPEGFAEKIVVDGIDHFTATKEGSAHIDLLYKQYLSRKKEKTRIKEIERTVDAKLEFYKRYLEKRVDATKKRQIIDFRELLKFAREYAEDLLDDPEQEMAIIKDACIDVVERKNITLGVHSLPKSQVLTIGHIRVEHIGKLYFFEGIIKQTSKSNAKVATAKFQCPSCGNNIIVPQLEQKFKEPSQCSCGRKGKMFLVSTDLRNFQVLKIEEKGEDLTGRTQAQDIDVILYDDLTAPTYQPMYNPGNQVRIIGILKSDYRFRHGLKSTEQFMFVEAVNCEPMDEIYDFKFTKKEEALLKKMSKDNQIVDKLVKSVAPGIFGFEEPKKAILCLLVGGGLLKGDKRSEPHILLVGDPGIAKTTLAKAILDLIPNSRFISGASASDVGISATVVKDEFSGQWSLRAGGLPLANNSVAVIDELDKKKDELNSLYEALESQEITVNKAGINAKLKCKTGVLATANPKFGRFDEHEVCVKQIDLPPPLMGRFDLVFAMRDSTKDDAGLADFLLDEVTGKCFDPPIIRSDLRKYLALARTFDPVLSASRKKYFKEQYLGLRKGVGVRHITPRLFLAMQRLSAGFAKLRLSGIIDICDIEAAISLVVDCYKDLLGDGDLDTLSTGFGSELRKKINLVLSLVPGGGEIISLEDLLKLCKLDEEELEDILRTLTDKAEICEPRRGRYQKLE